MSGQSRPPPPPPPHPRYNPVPSSSSSQRPTDPNDVTWLDFLRTAGNTIPSLDRSTSSERKRRHAGSSPERPDRRAIPYQPAITGRRPSGMSAGGSGNVVDVAGSGSGSGMTRESAIDLTTPSPRPRVVQRGNSNNDPLRFGGSIRAMNARAAVGLGRNDSELVLPRWQPDGDVSRCPVCNTEFSFWYRKHHCRKCGRVVCAACSPHRITIPRQYIVQPPQLQAVDTTGERSTPASPSGQGERYPRNLGGGEVVRVCNPCVPDPWTPEEGLSRMLGDGERERVRESIEVQVPHVQRPERYHPVPPPPPLQDRRGRAHAHTHHPAPGFSRSLPHVSQQTDTFIAPQPYNRPPPPPPPQLPQHQTRPHRYTHSSGSNPPFPPAAAARAAVQQPQPRPRRETREEDECPVCGTELPPGESVREAHIQECITLRFSSHAAPAPRQLPSTNTASTSLPSTSTAPAASPTAETGRPRATSYRPRGMAIYRATEKDCITEDGEAQECVICFEEFQPGDEMGRMECLCKFHRTCIKGWWAVKGVGGCPTHMLHE